MYDVDHDPCLASTTGHERCWCNCGKNCFYDLVSASLLPYVNKKMSLVSGSQANVIRQALN